MCRNNHKSSDYDHQATFRTHRRQGRPRLASLSDLGRQWREHPFLQHRRRHRLRHPAAHRGQPQAGQRHSFRAGFKTMLNEVYSLNCPNETGSMSKVLKRLADREVSINYMYAFQYMGISQAIIHAKDMERLKTVLTEYEKERLL